MSFRSVLFNFPVPERYTYLSGTWKLKLAKPKVEGTPTVRSISKKRGLYCGVSLVPIHHLLVPGGKLWMGTTETFLVYQNIIFELVVPSQPWCDPLFFTTPLILPKPNWLNESKGREFDLGFRNSVFWFPGIIKWKRPKSSGDAFDFKFRILQLIGIENNLNSNTEWSQQHNLYETVIQEVSNENPSVKSNLLRYKSNNTNPIPRQFIRNNVRQLI